MNLRPLIDDIAAQAPEILEAGLDRNRARSALLEFTRLEYPRLSAADHRLIAAHVMAVLEHDDFFPESYADAFAPEAAPDTPDDADA